MDHTANEGALDFLPDSYHDAQADASRSNCTTVIQHGPGPSIDPERPMPQAITLNQVLGSHVTTTGRNLMSNFVAYSNEIESPTSSFTANNNPVFLEALSQDTRLENPYYDFSFGVDLDFPILTGKPVVEVDLDVVDDILTSFVEFPRTMGLEASRANITALEPTAFSFNNTVNSASATGQSTINHMSTSQPEVGVTTASSSVPSSQNPQRKDGCAKVINTLSKHSNRVKHLAPKQLPIHRSYPPGSISTGNKHRTRKDRGQRRQRPNNKEGRQGKPRCAACRKAKSRCDFKSEYLPCDRCRLRNIDAPCRKLLGPKTEPQIAPSTQFPESTESREFKFIALLLDHVYSNKFENRDILLFSLIKRSGVAYGKCLEPIFLRHAIAAVSAYALPQNLYQGLLKKNINASYGELNIILERGTNEISEADVFATFLLGVIATANHLTASQVACYTSGCLLMLGICLTNEHTSSNRMLNDFGPLILDWLEIFHLRRRDPIKWHGADSVRRGLFSGTSPFDQRLRYIQSEHQEWRSNVGWAIRYTLAILADKLIWMIPVLANKEYLSQSDEEEYAEDVRISVKSELRDKTYQDAVAKSELWEEEIPTRAIIEKKSIEFLMVVLEPQTIVEGLQTPCAGSKARDLIVAHRSRESKNFHNFLLVAGMALSKEDVHEFRPWILRSLSQYAKSADSANAMEAFWINDSYTPESIVNVLRYSTN